MWLSALVPQNKTMRVMLFLSQQNCRGGGTWVWHAWGSWHVPEGAWHLQAANAGTGTDDEGRCLRAGCRLRHQFLDYKLRFSSHRRSKREGEIHVLCEEKDASALMAICSVIRSLPQPETEIRSYRFTLQEFIVFLFYWAHQNQHQGFLWLQFQKKLWCYIITNSWNLPFCNE